MRRHQMHQQVVPQGVQNPAAFQAGFQPAAVFPVRRCMQQAFRHQQKGAGLFCQQLGDGTAPPAAVPVQKMCRRDRPGAINGMNILRRFINQGFTPQKVEATPENVAKWEKKRPDGPSAATAAAWRNPSGNTASFTNRQAGKGTLPAVPAAADVYKRQPSR